MLRPVRGTTLTRAKRKQETSRTEVSHKAAAALHGARVRYLAFAYSPTFLFLSGGEEAEDITYVCVFSLCRVTPMSVLCQYRLVPTGTYRLEHELVHMLGPGFETSN